MAVIQLSNNKIDKSKGNGMHKKLLENKKYFTA